MAYCWIKRRGATWYLHFSKSLSLSPESLRTKDKTLAREIQRRRESDFFCGAQGIEKPLPEKIRYGELLQKYIEHKRASGLVSKSVSNYLKLLNHFGEFLQRDPPVVQIKTDQIESFIAQRRGMGKSPKTIRNEFFTLVNLFAWALERNYIASNPILHQLQGRAPAGAVRGGERQDCAAATDRRLHPAPAAAFHRHQAGEKHRAAAVCRQSLMVID